MSKLAIFECEIIQGGNVVNVPIPYGNLENMVRALLAHNDGTKVSVVGLNFMDLFDYGNKDL